MSTLVVALILLAPPAAAPAASDASAAGTAASAGAAATSSAPADPPAAPSSRGQAGPKLTVVIPADKAAAVDPRIGRVVLLVSEPLAEAPSGTLVLETRQNGAWVRTAHTAKGGYDAKTRQWRWLISPASFPENAEVRATLKLQGGKTESGKPLPAAPIVWTFTTTSASAARLQGLGKGGCPVDAASPGKPAGATPPPGAPCPK